MNFSGAAPDRLRGPEHYLAGCDEHAEWPRARDCWGTLQFGLLPVDNPHALNATTPCPGPVLREIMAQAGTVVTRGGRDVRVKGRDGRRSPCLRWLVRPPPT